MAEKQTTVHSVRTIILAVIGAFVLIGAWVWWYFWRSGGQVYDSLSAYLMSLPDNSLVKAKIGERTYIFEVANTPRSITQGLSDRREIGSDGMLFAMPAKTYHSFWMPRMQFDLDILWLDEEHIMQVMENVPAAPADASAWQIPRYTSDMPANVVLEIPSGRAKLNNIKAGDIIEVIEVVR